MSAKFVDNGKEYNRIEDTPPEIRSAYQSVAGLLADADQNGIPDILEGKGSNVRFSTSNVAVNIVHDGKVYTSAADLPPELREKYEKAMQAPGSIDSSGNTGADVTMAKIASLFSTGAAAHILHDGKVFTDPGQLPPEARARYEKAMKLLDDANQNGIPDIMESASALNPAAVSSTLPSSQTATVSSVPSAARSVPEPARPAEGGGRKLMIAALLMLLLAAIIVIVLLMTVIQSR